MDGKNLLCIVLVLVFVGVISSLDDEDFTRFTTVPTKGTAAGLAFTSVTAIPTEEPAEHTESNAVSERPDLESFYKDETASEEMNSESFNSLDSSNGQLQIFSESNKTYVPLPSSFQQHVVNTQERPFPLNVLAPAPNVLAEQQEQEVLLNDVELLDAVPSTGLDLKNVVAPNVNMIVLERQSDTSDITSESQENDSRQQNGPTRDIVRPIWMQRKILTSYETKGQYNRYNEYYKLAADILRLLN